jgi:hypothetical protein
MNDLLKATWTKIVLWISIYFLFELFFPIFDSHFWGLNGFPIEIWVPIKAIGIFVPYLIACLLVIGYKKLLTKSIF